MYICYVLCFNMFIFNCQQSCLLDLHRLVWLSATLKKFSEMRTLRELVYRYRYRRYLVTFEHL